MAQTASILIWPDLAATDPIQFDGSALVSFVNAAGESISLESSADGEAWTGHDTSGWQRDVEGDAVRIFAPTPFTAPFIRFTAAPHDLSRWIVLEVAA